MGGLSGTPGQATITPVYWAAPTYAFATTYKTIINGYLANVAQASGSNGNVFSVSTQYYQQSNASGAPQQHIQYQVMAGQEIIDASSYPAQGGSAGCTVPTGSAFTACVTDPALSTELTNLLTAAGKPMDDAHLYMVFLPQNVLTCVAPNTTSNVPCSTGTNGYCAYHNNTTTRPYLIYAAEPYPDLARCVDPTNGAQAPNGDAAADAQVSFISHEANESITDWAGAWMDMNKFENGDECAYVYGLPQGTAGAFYNQTIGGVHYYTQDEFSNEDFALNVGDPPTTGGQPVLGCVRQEELPTAAFTQTSPVNAGQQASFDASSSSDPDNSTAPLTYSWTWGDGTPNGSGVKPTHIFCVAGAYTVMLKVTDSSGWQATSSQPMTVTQGPPAVTALMPASGISMGGTSVSIRGCALTGVTAVRFGTTPAASFSFVSDQQVTAISPAEAPGSVDVIVTTSLGTSSAIPADTFTFAGWTSLGGLLTSGPGQSSWGPSHTDVFVRGGDGQLYHNWFTGSAWQGFQPLGGSLSSDPAAISWGANRIDIFSRGPDNQLWHTWWDGAQWNGWQPLGGSLNSGPDVSSWAPNRLDVFTRGPDNQLWHTWWDGTRWNAWQPLGGQLASDPTAVSWGMDRIDVFAKGFDGQLWHTWWDGTRWNAWQPLGGLLNSGPEAASCASGHLDVFVTGGDRALYQLGYDGANWLSWKRIGGQWSSDPGAVCITGTKNIAVFNRGDDAALWNEVLGGS